MTEIFSLNPPRPLPTERVSVVRWSMTLDGLRTYSTALLDLDADENTNENTVWYLATGLVFTTEELQESIPSNWQLMKYDEPMSPELLAKFRKLSIDYLRDITNPTEEHLLKIAQYDATVEEPELTETEFLNQQVISLMKQQTAIREIIKSYNGGAFSYMADGAILEIENILEGKTK